MAEWKLGLYKETSMCGYDIQGCQLHMDVYVGDYTTEPCEDCGTTEDCHKVIYFAPQLQLGYVWQREIHSEDGEYTFYPTVDQAKVVFESLKALGTMALTYGIAGFEERANNCLVPMEMRERYNLY